MNNTIKNEMPLMKHIDRLFRDNSRYVVVACQHFLEPNAEMLLKLVDRGFDPKKMYIIPKAYSHNVEIAKILKDARMKIVGPLYYPEDSFDETHKQNVAITMSRVMNKYPTKDYILMDDGGTVINYANNIMNEVWKRFYPKTIAGVEQTSSGYNLLHNKELHMPVINIARSNSKLGLESPYIAELVVSRLEDYLRNNNKTVEHNTLILGAGPIGLSIRDKLRDKHQVTLYDTSSKEYTVLEKLVKDKDIIIGCTGDISIPHEYHKHLKNTVLVNAASSDREFDAHHLRKECEKYSNDNRIVRTTHKNYDLSKIGLEGSVLLNGGFPITFLGNKIEGDANMMQITFGLMYAGILSLTQKRYANGFHQLNPEIEKSIRNRYENLIGKK